MQRFDIFFIYCNRLRYLIKNYFFMEDFLHIARDWILRWLPKRGGSGEINMPFHTLLTK